MPYTRPPKLNVWASTAPDNVQPSAPELSAGWPNSVTPPARGRFNWFFNLVHNAIAYLTRRGISDWLIDEDYLTGDRVMGSDLKTYQALQDSTGQDPTASPTYWEPWAFLQSDSDTRYALKNGEVGEVFAVAPAGANNQAPQYSQILPTGAFSFVEATAGTFASAVTLPPFSKARVFLQAGGGGGGCSDEEGVVSQDATSGGDTYIRHATTAVIILLVQGGGRGQNAQRYGANTYLPPSTPVSESNVEFPTVAYKNLTFTLNQVRGISPKAGGLYQPQKPAGMNNTGTGGAGDPGQTNIAPSSSGNGGAFIEALLVNNTADPLPLTVVIGAGGQKTISVWGTGQDGIAGSAAIQIEEV